MKRIYDSTGIKIENFTPAPSGIYTLIIRQIFDTDKDGLPRKTEKGDDYISVRCEIDDPSEWLGTTVWHGVTIMNDKTRKGAGMAIHFLKTIEEAWEGKFDIDTDRWIGKTFRAKLIIEKDFKGKDRNAIAYLIDDEKPSNGIPSTNEPPYSEEVPF